MDHGTDWRGSVGFRANNNLVGALLVGICVGAGAEIAAAVEVAVNVGIGTEFLNNLNLDGDGVVAGFDNFKRFGAEPNDDLGVIVGGNGIVRGFGKPDASMSEIGIAVPRQHEGAQVHGGRADETCHKLVGWGFIHFAGSAYLLQHAVFNHGNAITHGECFSLVVGDIHSGHAKLALQSGNLRASLHTKFRIQVTQWLVHEEHFGTADDSATHSNTLTLTTRQCLG